MSERQNALSNPEGQKSNSNWLTNKTVEKLTLPPHRENSCLTL